MRLDVQREHRRSIEVVLTGNVEEPLNPALRAGPSVRIRSDPGADHHVGDQFGSGWVCRAWVPAGPDARNRSREDTAVTRRAEEQAQGVCHVSNSIRLSFRSLMWGLDE